MLSVEVAAHIEPEVSGGPSPMELGDAALRALGVSNVLEPQRSVTGSGALLTVVTD